MSDEKKYPSDLADRFQLRMPPGLRDRIADAAKVNKRSMNAEILARLEASLSGSKVPSYVPGAYLRDIRKLLSELQQAIGIIEDENFDMRGNKFRREMTEELGRAALAELEKERPGLLKELHEQGKKWLEREDESKE